jgi:short-subunit dehydrogenase
MKTAVVTGAASGMGRLVAERLAARGTEVLALDRSEVGLQSLAELSDRIQPVAVDITDPEAVTQAVGPTDGRLDLLVCAAGIGHSKGILETPFEEFDKLVHVNYLGTVATVKAALPAMLDRGSGHIATFASMAGWVPAAKHAPYNSTKSAVIMFSEILRLETRGQGVSVSCVCPPAVRTPLLDDMPVSAAAAERYVKPLTPLRVVESLERAIEADRFWVFPDPVSKSLWRLRRYAPRALDAVTRRLLGS